MIEELIKNKKIIIIGLFIILIVFILTYVINNKQYFIKEKIDEIYEEIKKYDANKFVPVYITEDDMAKKYLNDYKNLMLSNKEEAYNLLNENYRTKKFGNFDKFKEYINNIISLSFYNITVDKYTIVNSNKGKFYYIYDTSGRKYIFKEISIMNYEVYFDEYTVDIK